MTDSELAERILSIIRLYRVNAHYDGSAQRRRRVYAVWANDGQNIEQVIEPTTHGEAVACRDHLIVADLLELLMNEIEARK